MHDSSNIRAQLQCHLLREVEESEKSPLSTLMQISVIVYDRAVCVIHFKYFYFYLFLPFFPQKCNLHESRDLVVGTGTLQETINIC